MLRFFRNGTPTLDRVRFMSHFWAPNGSIARSIRPASRIRTSLRAPAWHALERVGLRCERCDDNAMPWLRDTVNVIGGVPGNRDDRLTDRQAQEQVA